MKTVKAKFTIYPADETIPPIECLITLPYKLNNIHKILDDACQGIEWEAADGLDNELLKIIVERNNTSYLYKENDYIGFWLQRLDFNDFTLMAKPSGLNKEGFEQIKI